MDFPKLNSDCGAQDAAAPSLAVPEGCRPETAAVYAPALRMYSDTDLSVAEICRKCGVSVKGFAGYVRTYHRHLMLRRNGIECTPAEAEGIKLRPRRGQYRKTHEKYRAAIEACGSMEYIESSVSEIAREFGLTGTNLARQLRTHYPDVLEIRERARQRMGVGDNLPRGQRKWCRSQYAEAVEMLRSDSYITVREAAERCGVSYSGLEQHLVFYHKDLVDARIEIRGNAVNRKERGQINGRGMLHEAAPEIVAKYAGALELYRTTPMSARQIAKMAGVSVKGFYGYLQTWHRDLICLRKGIPYEEGEDINWSGVRRYSASAAAKYAGVIERLKEGGVTVAQAAADFGLHAECLRQYIKEHEPELYAALGMTRNKEGKLMSASSMEKYKEAIERYEAGGESLRSIATRFGFNCSSLRQFINRNFPSLIKQKKETAVM